MDRRITYKSTDYLAETSFANNANANPQADGKKLINFVTDTIRKKLFAFKQ